MDTGCSRTVNRDLVPENKIIEGEAVAIRCAHVNTELYPLAQVSLEVDGRLMEVETTVSSTLPMDVLLGMDNPELVELVAKEQQATENAFAVTTRASTYQEAVSEEE